MKIRGVRNLSGEELAKGLAAGGRFVVYQYCISILLLSRLAPTDVYYIPAGESRTSKGLEYTVLSCVLGWWCFPWGPIHTITALATNFAGGNDVTEGVLLDFGFDQDAVQTNRYDPALLQKLCDSGVRENTLSAGRILGGVFVIGLLVWIVIIILLERRIL